MEKHEREYEKAKFRVSARVHNILSRKVICKKGGMAIEGHREKGVKMYLEV